MCDRSLISADRSDCAALLSGWGRGTSRPWAIHLTAIAVAPCFLSVLIPRGQSFCPRSRPLCDELPERLHETEFP